MLALNKQMILITIMIIRFRTESSESASFGHVTLYVKTNCSNFGIITAILFMCQNSSYFYCKCCRKFAVKHHKVYVDGQIICV